VVALHHALTSDSVTGNFQLKLSTSLKLSIPRGPRPTQLGGNQVHLPHLSCHGTASTPPFCSSPTDAAREPRPTLPPLKLATAKILCQLIDLGSAFCPTCFNSAVRRAWPFSCVSLDHFSYIHRKLVFASSR
jgi:hypothetical protein